MTKPVFEIDDLPSEPIAKLDAKTTADTITSNSELSIEQYQCTQCHRYFYIAKNDISCFDFGFGCPYGCDDNGKHTRTILAEVKKVTENGKDNVS